MLHDINANEVWQQDLAWLFGAAPEFGIFGLQRLAFRLT
jgi:hypothetical protein